MGQLYGRYLKTPFLLIGYSLSSGAVVTLNRKILLRAPYPFLNVAWQLTAATVIHAVWSSWTPKGHLKPATRPRLGSQVALTDRIFSSIWLSVLLFVGMMVMNSLCQKYLSVPSYVVARGCTLIFTVLLSRLVLGSRVNKLTWLACVIVVVGTTAGSLKLDGSMSLTPLGVLAGVASSSMQGCYNVSSKALLQRQVLDPESGGPENRRTWVVTKWASLFCWIITFLLSDYPADFESLKRLPWIALTLAGFLSFAVNLTAGEAMNRVSAITFNLVGYVKSVVQACLAPYFLSEPMSGNEGLALAITIWGSLIYSYSQHKNSSFFIGSSTSPGAGPSPEKKME